MIGNLVGSYKITDKIGEGGMGAVFRGIDVMLEREVAIKMLRPELSRQPDVVERFRSEAVTLAKLNHPNIATLYSFLRQGDDFFMVMEFVRGDTLDTVIRRAGAMACDRGIALLCQALEGIDHAHRMGIIHRDIKPANMMLTEHGTLKVMDFGIARVLGTARMTKQGNIVGTIEYMSPEQVRGLETDARSDIYSLGILLYEMLTGRVPFASDSEFDLMKMQIEDSPQPPRVFATYIPQVVEQAIMRALAKRPETRFQTAAEFRKVLFDVIRDVPAASVGALAAASPPPTRIAEQVVNAAPSFSARETRLAGEASAPLGYAVAQPAFQQPAPMAPQGKSNVKLFIGIAAAAVLITIVGVSVALFSGGKTPTRPPSAPPTQPAQSTNPSVAPSSGGSQTPIPAQPPPQPMPQVAQPKPAIERLAGGTVPAVDNSNKVARTARRESDAEAAARKEKARKAAEARRLLNQ